MHHWNNYEDFEIDVDTSALFGHGGPETLIDADLYLGAHPPWAKRGPQDGNAIKGLRSALWNAQWQAALWGRDERRRAARAPMLSRVTLNDGARMTTTDISLSGFRCSGRPRQTYVDVELKLPGLDFPVDARAEVMHFKDANVIPLVGMRFVDIDRPYLDHISRYIQRRMRKAA